MKWFQRDPAREAEKRCARARRFMEEKDYNEVRLELEGIEGPEAEALRTRALAQLVELNLTEARFRLAMGERAEAGSALARARSFGASPDQLAAFRRRSGGGGPPPA